MQDRVYRENYPLWIVIISNLQAMLVYAAGIILMYLAGLIWALLYVLLITALELRLLGKHCIDCYYYGKICAFGKGRISSFLFRKGDPDRFCMRKITKKDLIPDLLVIVIPVLFGLVLMILKFQWLIPVLIIILIFAGSAGTAFVRGNLACRYCRQKEAGCPAFQLFEKKDPDK